MKTGLPERRHCSLLAAFVQSALLNEYHPISRKNCAFLWLPARLTSAIGEIALHEVGARFVSSCTITIAAF